MVKRKEQEGSIENGKRKKLFKVKGHVVLPCLVPTKGIWLEQSCWRYPQHAWKTPSEASSHSITCHGTHRHHVPSEVKHQGGLTGQISSKNALPDQMTKQLTNNKLRT